RQQREATARRGPPLQRNVDRRARAGDGVIADRGDVMQRAPEEKRRLCRHFAQQVGRAQIHHEILRLRRQRESDARQRLQKKCTVGRLIRKVSMHMRDAEPWQHVGKVEGIAAAPGGFVSS
ncbi:MAG: hypothetical protein ACK55I_11290, partial [bacterium]